MGIFCQQTEVGLCGEGGSLQTKLFSQAKPHSALQPANFGVQLNSQRVADPEIVQSFLLLSCHYTGSLVYKMNIAVFSRSSLLP